MAMELGQDSPWHMSLHWQAEGKELGRIFCT